ncbi:hypothetical protein LRN_1112 [Ligilactobacillus ruminis DPC 6832]|uniref:Uncharacterized protein n=1 Tax=Ligilactobacillus ruminis DPC 6832 TaxID=1402208 RepID=A0A837DYK5_9LACO|nr:hypothetical protein LRN_1112 [Ligilactobacillus ruminis DPC 6832]
MQTSEGWTLTIPKLIHALAPLTGAVKNKTYISKKIVINFNKLVPNFFNLFSLSTKIPNIISSPTKSKITWRLKYEVVLAFAYAKLVELAE